MKRGALVGATSSFALLGSLLVTMLASYSLLYAMAHDMLLWRGLVPIPPHVPPPPPPHRDMVPDYYDMASSSRSEEEVGALRQVRAAPHALNQK